MTHSDLSVLVDGIMSIGTHNNVHRIVCYRLTAENKPEPAIELIVPAASLPGFIAALSRLSGAASAAEPAKGTPSPVVMPARIASAGVAHRPKKDTTSSG
jgi:hypothetical protein